MRTGPWRGRSWLGLKSSGVQRRKMAIASLVAKEMQRGPVTLVTATHDGRQTRLRLHRGLLIGCASGRHKGRDILIGRRGLPLQRQRFPDPITGAALRRQSFPHRMTRTAPYDGRDFRSDAADCPTMAEISRSGDANCRCDDRDPDRMEGAEPASVARCRHKPTR